MKSFLHIGGALITFLLLSAEVLAGYPSPDDWRNENIYFIFTDRFFDGNPSNDNANPQSAYNPTDSHRIHGGDFKGIERKLDYIKAIGATAIWITPIPQNVGDSGYHGYGADNFYQLQPNWGTMSEFTSMTATAHAKGIRVILDIVCNHQGNRISSGDSGYPTYKDAGYTLRWTTTNAMFPPPFNSLSNFHNKGQIPGSPSTNQEMLGELGSLDDLQTDTTYVRTNMLNIYSYWMTNADLDGFRIDTVKHVDIGFWQFFNPGIRAVAAAMGKTNFFQFGEALDGNDSKCGYYTGTKGGGAYANDAVVDYPLYFRVNSVFATASGNTKQIEDRYAALAANYDVAAQERLVTFLDNHDQARFMSSNNANNNTNRLAVALTFLYSSRGVPCLYYGTEQNFNGSTDPNNREDMFAGKVEPGASVGDNFNMTQGTFLHVAKLNNFRRLYPSLRTGTHTNLWNNPNSPGLFAYERRLGTEEVYVVFNTSGSSQTVPALQTIYPAGTKIVNLFNTNESVIVTAGASGIPAINVSGTSAKMFVADSLLKPLDPLVINQTPKHALTNVSTLASIVLQFSKPMDTSSVQAAFSIQPATVGTFSWSTNHDTMTFTPSGGYPTLTTNVVRVSTNAMDSVSSNTLFAPFETFFRTAAAGAITDNIPPSVSITTPAPGSVLSGPLTFMGTATDNLAVSLVEFRLDNGTWLATTGTTSWSFAFNSVNFLNGSHTLSARSTDSVGNLSTNASVAVRFVNVPNAYEARISPGNPGDATNCDAKVWLRDRPYSFGSFGYSGGVSGILTNAISGVCQKSYPLYQRERYSSAASSFDYLFDCPAGVYEVTLLESENYVTNANLRLFDLFIEDHQVLANFDIFATAGGMYIPITLVITSAVADAQLNMHFFPLEGFDNARASGIQVKKIGDVDTDADGVPDWWMLGYFDHSTGQEADQSRADDDADSDGVKNKDEFISGTDPTDSNSFLRVTDFSVTNGAAVSFMTVSGRSYMVQCTTDLTNATTWMDIPAPIQGSGDIVSVVDTNTAERRHYRIVVGQP